MDEIAKFQTVVKSQDDEDSDEENDGPSYFRPPMQSNRSSKKVISQSCNLNCIVIKRQTGLVFEG